MGVKNNNYNNYRNIGKTMTIILTTWIISHQTLIVSRSTNVKSRRKLLIKLLPSYSSNIHITMTVLNISIISVRVAPSLHLAFTLNFDVIWYNFYLSLRQPSRLGRKHTPDMKTHFNKTKMRRAVGWGLADPDEMELQTSALQFV